MYITAYDIALIGGGFTIIGALIGALVTYQFSLKLMQRSMRLETGRRLVAAFSDELVALDPVNKKPNTDVEHLLQNQFSKHYAAVLKFSYYLRGKEKNAFLQAWQDYYEVGGSVRFYDYCIGEKPYEVFRERVNNILKFTDT